LAIDTSFGQLETWNIIKRRNYIRQLMLQASQLINFRCRFSQSASSEFSISPNS
jgi:hypothetical protein